MTLLRLNGDVWINPEEIAKIAWEPDGVEGRKRLYIYRKGAQDVYPDKVARDCELDICKALGLEMPPPALQPIDAGDRSDGGAEGS